MPVVTKTWNQYLTNLLQTKHVLIHQIINNLNQTIAQTINDAPEADPFNVSVQRTAEFTDQLTHYSLATFYLTLTKWDANFNVIQQNAWHALIQHYQENIYPLSNLKLPEIIHDVIETNYILDQSIDFTLYQTYLNEHAHGEGIGNLYDLFNVLTNFEHSAIKILNAPSQMQINPL